MLHNMPNYPHINIQHTLLSAHTPEKVNSLNGTSIYDRQWQVQDQISKIETDQM